MTVINRGVREVLGSTFSLSHTFHTNEKLLYIFIASHNRPYIALSKDLSFDNDVLDYLAKTYKKDIIVNVKEGEPYEI